MVLIELITTISCNQLTGQLINHLVHICPLITGNGGLVLLRANEAKAWGTSIYSYVKVCLHHQLPYAEHLVETIPMESEQPS